ncbi:RHS repeat-associated core domain-containing protein [Pseudomonas sp. 148P]|uniref:RHS repeat-associated core domain-containing protein n=1 Tax=Pseudomonas ulcerans TaxID=3115852 RepID=A0ABU7HJ90_9PSED|nr:MULTISPECIES: RHS repeat-associated core domain-containing protein [unclassified Pseudomonas]MEE1921314.1 RHS repeat-associated core domain-containing protein [Pseudomonas sp. 147P]MEE1931597.1 RHS repeat-associated core domain-containing protein [Pseudomonas sp. 148P]
MSDKTAKSLDSPARKTGYYLLGQGYRAYNPVLMRFTSADSWSPFGRGGLNAYAYCAGDPVNASDPSGHFLWFGNMKFQLTSLASRMFSSSTRFRPQQSDWYFEPTGPQSDSPRTSVTMLSSYSSMASLGATAPTTRPVSTTSKPAALELALNYLPADDLTRLRLVSKEMRGAVDRFSRRNFDDYLKRPAAHPGIENRGLASDVEKVIGAAAGKVPGVSMAEASLNMKLVDAKTRFKATHDYTWDVEVGLGQRQEYFKGTWKQPTHVLVKAVRKT